jgi:hypothetical protein
MHRLLLSFCLISCSALADEAHDSAVIGEMLKVHAPRPDWRAQLSDPAFLRSIDHRPAEDADDETLAEYWREAPAATAAPDRAVRLRLLEICTRDPGQLPALLRWFGEPDEEIAAKLKAIYNQVAAKPAKSFAPADLHDWLMEHSRYFRDELIAKTRETFAGADAQRLRESVQTLARLDRHAAEELLRSLRESGNAFTRAAALVALLELEGAGSATELETWRAELRRMAADAATPPRARDYAISGLMRKPWPGDEEWFPGLFADASLAEIRLEDPLITPLHPLSRVVAGQPARWVPKLLPMLEAEDRTLRGNAAVCLAGLPQVEALRPLLPWLTDASWSPFGGDEARRELARSLAKVDLPEAGPGLVALLRHGDSWQVIAAAEALAPCPPESPTNRAGRAGRPRPRG